VRDHAQGWPRNARSRLRRGDGLQSAPSAERGFGRGIADSRTIASQEGAGMRTVTFGDRIVGAGQPTYIVAEIGINHNGSTETAQRLIDAAVLAGCNAVKFQKRTPELCVPERQRDMIRETPWGTMTYLEYRRRMEFGAAQYEALIRYCRDRSVDWFASC